MENPSAAGANATETHLSPKELFEHLFKELSEVYERYKKYVYTTTATQVLIMGWFITSDKAKEFAKNENFAVAWVCVVLFFIFIEAVIGLYLRYRSNAIGNFIKALNFIEHKYYSFKIITVYMVAIVVIGHVVLYVFMTIILMILLK